MMFVATIFAGCNNDDEPTIGSPTPLGIEVQGTCVIKTEVDETNSLITYYVPIYTPISELAKCRLVLDLKDGTLSEESKNIDLTSEEVKIVIEGRENKEYTVKRITANVENITRSIVSKYKGEWITTVNGVKDETELKYTPILFVQHTEANTVSMTLDRFAMVDGPTFLNIAVENIYLYDKKDSIAISGVSKENLRIDGVKTDVIIDVTGFYYVEKNKIKLTIGVSGVEGKQIVTTFEGDTYALPNDVMPLFISVKGSKVLSQTFSQGDLTYYGDVNNKPTDYSDMTIDVKVPAGADWKNPMTGNKEFDFTQQQLMVTVFSIETPSKNETHFVKRVEVDPNFKTEFDFTEWIGIQSFFNPKGWETSNQAVALINSTQKTDYDYPVTETEMGRIGKGATITTIDTKGGTIMGVAFPKVTSGSIYLGTFDFMAAMKNPLLATKFGVPYSGKLPVSLTLWYKYTPGADYYDGVNKVDGTVDAPSVAVVLYDITDNMTVSLTGVDIFDSPRIVAKGIAYPTKNTADFRETTIQIKMVSGKTYDTTKNKYKLAIILSSSKDGAAFKGAPGSTFTVDEIKLVTK